MTLPSGWSETAQATNALATATHSAESDKQHKITGLIASLSDSTVTALLTIKDGSVIKHRQYIHGSDSVVLPQGGFKGTKGNAVSAELAAGGSTIVGTVTILGDTF